MDTLYDLMCKVLDPPKFMKILAVLFVFFLLIGIKGSCSGDHTPKSAVPSWNESKPEPAKPKRHSLVIYEVKMMPEDNKFKFEYITDLQTIWSSAVYAIGDTISFTTRKLKKQFDTLKSENVKLKDEIARREKAWQSIKRDIQKALLGY